MTVRRWDGLMTADGDPVIAGLGFDGGLLPLFLLGFASGLEEQW